ncbi:Catenin-beta-like protein [Xylaria sp. CBS 124048]|nr:Catenin-beta-like protein [Xylaria sp. CBS 124048]
MAGIDDLFKASGVANKRKLEPLRDPNEVHKAARLQGNSSRHARIADHKPADADTEAGPAPPPEGDDPSDYQGHDPRDYQGDYAPYMPSDEDDEEGGRFFGGGVTAQEAQVLDYLGDADADAVAVADAAPEKMDIAWLRRTALSFEKKISHNAEQRAKFEHNPAKFIVSEAELDGEIRALSILSEHPELYPEFARLGCVGSLVGLLAHENTDIAIDAIEIIDELTDEDVAAEEAQYDAMVEALLEADLLSLLVSNLDRFDETQKADRDGVYRALGIVENLCGRTVTAERVAEEENLLKWLLSRIQAKDAGGVRQNKQYSAEILAILVQDSAKNRLKLISLDAVDIMLQLLAPYRKRDPEKGCEEEEYAENLFEALTCIVNEPRGKTKFVEAEGVELCLIMLKEGKMSKKPSLRLLDHAAGGTSGAHIRQKTEVCQKIVEAGGLKTIFTLFMKKSIDHLMAEHLIGIFASMLRLLPTDSAERIRFMAKFVEKSYEKLKKLVEMRQMYAARVNAVDKAIRAEQAQMSAEEREDMADEWFSRRLDAGLFSLQTLDVVLASLLAEDYGMGYKIQELLVVHGSSLAAVKETIQEQMAGIAAEDADDQGMWDLLRILTLLM